MRYGIVRWAVMVLLPGAAAGQGREGGQDMGSSIQNLIRNVGKEVVVEGAVSPFPSQHIVAGVPGKNPEYFDLASGDQTVIYVPRDFPCKGKARVTGRVMKVDGGGKGQKSEEPFSEYHIDVSSWECLDTELDQLIQRLADPGLPADEKQQIEEAIISGGKTAIPALIDLLKDKRVCWTEKELLNEGELMNRPPNAPPVQEIWMETPVTLGERSDWMLLMIITPKDYESPYVSRRKPHSSGRDSYLFRVEDWAAWWEKNGGKTIEQIHQEMKAVVDAYWQSNGIEQAVR